uniref:Peptidase S54 rhomboid domain-containing protein n=1 Tax=Pinguiococcus pyrenoidosus TaxID=172671 RepID=A0A7R9U9C6_9STRA|mmetsp:Transcript_2094/g.9184  ORF Transcript_2094/g.9184 Transcript_2094/m.9184 type:complete len:230 (+) Transcript_2094:1-690(+)
MQSAARRSFSIGRRFRPAPWRNGDGSWVVYSVVGAQGITWIGNDFGDVSVRRFLRAHFRSSWRDAVELGRPHGLFLSCVHCADFWDFLFAALGTYFIGTQLVVPAVGSAAFAAFYFGAGGAANLFAAFYANSHPRLSKPPGFRVYLNKYSEVSGTQGSLGALLGFAAVAAPTASVYIYGVVPVPLGLAAALFLGFPIYQAYQHGVRDAAVVAQLAGAMLGAGRFLALRS